ncbi:hypothetical protein GWK91_03280 [Virgibacillus sp. MSP4-1]|uniref:hypothetical protein n=1 Tax=Virgibacillus sp. MSP4-1 TaxID=2700081 RepID=UPI00039A84B1|nr:hypothetical protein [Virgibacillus sp. MSP4-1]QHS22025.1 hypothetical protein GWK91_03280 [Virgibacillus sp. MSP4-1]
MGFMKEENCSVTLVIQSRKTLQMIQTIKVSKIGKRKFAERHRIRTIAERKIFRNITTNFMI